MWMSPHKKTTLASRSSPSRRNQKRSRTGKYWAISIARAFNCSSSYDKFSDIESSIVIDLKFLLPMAHRSLSLGSQNLWSTPVSAATSSAIEMSPTSARNLLVMFFGDKNRANLSDDTSEVGLKSALCFCFANVGLPCLDTMCNADQGKHQSLFNCYSTTYRNRPRSVAPGTNNPRSYIVLA